MPIDPNQPTRAQPGRQHDDCDTPPDAHLEAAYEERSELDDAS